MEQEKLDSELLEVGSGEHELPEVPVSIKEPIGVGQQQKQKGISNKAKLFITLNFRLINFYLSLFLVRAKVIEEDEDLKLLESWAN